VALEQQVLRLALLAQDDKVILVTKSDGNWTGVLRMPFHVTSTLSRIPSWHTQQEVPIWVPSD
jgi:hypothetical protein